MEDVVERLAPGNRARGVVEAAHIAHVSTMTIGRYLKSGKVTDMAAGIALAEAHEPRNCTARWALAHRLAFGT